MGRPSSPARCLLGSSQSIGDQNAIEVADAVKEYVSQAAGRLPPGVRLDTWRDRSLVVKARLNTLVRNAIQGSILILLLLTLFLRGSVAFWVLIGMPIAFMGGIAMMPVFGVTLNLISLFAFILGKFAWGPLLGLIEEREGKIREAVESSEKANAEAQALLEKEDWREQIVAIEVMACVGGCLKWLCGGPGNVYLYVDPELAPGAAQGLEVAEVGIGQERLQQHPVGAGERQLGQREVGGRHRPAAIFVAGHGDCALAAADRGLAQVQALDRDRPGSRAVPGSSHRP